MTTNTNVNCERYNKRYQSLCNMFSKLPENIDECNTNDILRLEFVATRALKIIAEMLKEIKNQ